MDELIARDSHRRLKGPTDDTPDRHDPTHPPRRLHRARHPVHPRRRRSTRPPFRRLVRWQVLAGIDGLVPCGTTGESPTLSTDERERLIAPTVEVVAERPSRDRVRVVAGTGTNDTAATIRATRRAAELGADAALVVAPYYNRPDSRMLEAHFRAIADEGDLPVVVYNVPSRTGTNVDADTFLRLAEHPRVIAVKEASGNLEQIARICRDRPRDVAVLAGDDAWTLPILAMGGDGVVSVASNEIPGELVALCAAARSGRLGRRATDPRALAATVPGQLPRCPEPGPGEGRPRVDGPARDRHRPRAAPAARAGRVATMDATLRMLGLVEPAGGRFAPRRHAAARRSHDRRGRRTRLERRDAPASRPPSTRGPSSTTWRPAGSGRPSPTRPLPAAGASGPTSRPRSCACFADRTTVDWRAGPLLFRDRAAVPPRDDLAGGPWRIVPGGTAVRRGAHLGDGVVVMPPSYVNVGAWVGDGTMVDSHVLVGSCAQIGARVHLAAGVDDRWRARAAGRAPGHRRGRRVRRRRQRPPRGRPRRPWGGHRRRGDPHRVVAAVRPRPGRVLQGTRRAPLAVPPDAVVVPGSRALGGAFAEEHGLSLSVALLVKDRDAGTSARVALEETLR